MIDQYKDAFKEEAYEILATLETALLEVENKPDDKELIAKIFRALHTIKGSSGMFGFDEVTIFTHNIETLYDHIRNGEVIITKEIINLTLAACDQIRLMLESTDKESKVDRNKVKEIVAEFSNIITGMKKGAAKKEEVKIAPVHEDVKKTSSKTIFLINFIPSQDIFLSGTNPSSLLNELSRWGMCFIKAHTEEIPALDSLDPEKCYISWDIILVTEKDENDIKDLFIFIEDDSKIKISVIKDENKTNENEYPNLFNSILDENQKITPEVVESKLNKKEAAVKQDVNSTAHKNTSKQKNVVKEKEVKHQESDGTSSIRVNADKLDNLVNLVGELVTVQAHLSQIANFKDDPDFIAISEDIERLTWELRDSALNIRMVPIEIIFSKFKRLVRDLSMDLGKDIEFVTEGGETELDKIVIEHLNDPLVHLIRNCVDHGIETPSVRKKEGKSETGNLILSAIHSGTHVLINITDDGAGMDKDAIYAKAVEKGLIPAGIELSEKEIFNLIFTPGFSTAKAVTNVSGRGVGMDVVKRSIESMRGSVEIISEKGIGTTITLKIPLTLAIIEGLLVKSGDEHFIIPLSLVEECIELTKGEVIESHGKQIKNVRGELIPYLSLRERFHIKNEPPEVEQIVIINLNDTKTGIVVDHVVGGHQTVIKPLGKCFKELNDISGATIMGDGSIALILDIAKLIRDEEKVQKEFFELADKK